MIPATRSRRITLFTCAVLLSALASAARLRAQQQYPGLAPAEETTTVVRGQVVSFSMQDHVLLIRAENGDQMTFGLDEHTNMISPIDPGSSVEVTYAVVDGKNMARTLVNPAVMLQLEHPTDRVHLMPLIFWALVVVVIAVVVQQWRARRRRE